MSVSLAINDLNNAFSRQTVTKAMLICYQFGDLGHTRITTQIIGSKCIRESRLQHVDNFISIWYDLNILYRIVYCICICFCMATSDTAYHIDRNTQDTYRVLWSSKYQLERYQGPILLTWLTLIPIYGWVITCSVKSGVKLFIHS